MAKTVNVALIGQGFMGRTHSNAYLKVAKFFTDLPLVPVMHTIVRAGDREPAALRRRWGWKNCATDWKSAIRNEEIDLVDIVTPNHMHMPPAIAALEAGKPVATEKPLAGTLADARADGRGRQEGQGADVRLVQLPPRPGRRAGASAGEGRQASGRHLPRPLRLPAGLGRAGHAAALAVPEEVLPAAAPTAT